MSCRPRFISLFSGSLTCYEDAGGKSPSKRLCAPSEFCYSRKSELEGNDVWGCAGNKRNLECVYIDHNEGFTYSAQKEISGRSGSSSNRRYIHDPEPPIYVTRECYCRQNLCNSLRNPCVCPPNSKMEKSGHWPQNSKNTQLYVISFLIIFVFLHSLCQSRGT